MAEPFITAKQERAKQGRCCFNERIMAPPTFRSRAERASKRGKRVASVSASSVVPLSFGPFQRSQFNRLHCHLHDVCEQFGGGEGGVDGSNEATATPTTQFMTPKHEWQAKQARSWGGGETGEERRGEDREEGGGGFVCNGQGAEEGVKEKTRSEGVSAVHCASLQRGEACFAAHARPPVSSCCGAQL